MSRRRSIGLLAASALCWSAAECCGVLVHNEILRRSARLFALPNSTPDLASLTPLVAPLLTDPRRAPSLQAGAFFPDWGYQCLSTDDAAEAAHWPPFLVASVEHIVAKYGYLNQTLSRPAAEQDHLESLVAFVFAVASHQASDATWHAIRLPTGFLAALSAIDFAGDIAKAHRVLDVGGDFVLAARLARMGPASRAWIGDEWRVPVQDLVAIYARLGRDVNAYVLRYCTMRGLAALRSDIAVGPRLADGFVAQSPMLLAEMDGYHLGGIDEMSQRTVACWANLTRWFVRGVERDEKLRDGWGVCDVFQAIKARGGAGDTHRRRGGAAEYDVSGITVTEDGFGAEIYSLPPLHPPPPPPPPQHREICPAGRFKDPVYIATYTPYSQFGASLSYGAFSPSGPALAVGAPLETEDSARPGEGNVYIIPVADLLSPSSSSLFSPLRAPDAPATDQRFGTASAAIRTRDTTLLAVSAPGPHTYDPATPPSLPFSGTAPAGRIDVFRAGAPTRFLSLRVRGSEMGSLGRRWWGGRIIAADFGDGDGDAGWWVVVGGSRSDGTRVCEGRVRVQLGEGEVGVFRIDERGAAQDGEAVATDTEAEVEVEVEPGQQTTAQSGQLQITTWSLTLPGPKDLPCSKTDTYEQFGAALAFLARSRTLLVGAPGAGGGGGGRVFAYSFDSSRDGAFAHTFTIAAPLAAGARTGFGGAGLVGGVSAAGVEWVVVAAPDEDVDGDAQAGVVRVYVLDRGKDGAVAPRQVAEVVAASGGGEQRRYGKFGKTVVAGGGGVWVGSEFWDGETGAVWWVDVAGLVEEDADKRSGGGGEGRAQTVLMQKGLRLEVDVELKGEEPNARFGASLAVGDEGELFVGIPYSGVSGEEQDTRFYGAVAVFRRK